MSEEPVSKLRIYAGFNSCMEDDRGAWCWLLRHDGGLLDEVAASLDLKDGLPVTLYYDDPAEEFEVDAVLGRLAGTGWDARWIALPDWNTLRRLRG